MAYLDVPFVSSTNIGVFADIFQAARTSERRIAILGDSQETAPAGQGEPFVSGLNAAFAMAYQNTPASNLCTGGSYGGNGNNQGLQGRWCCGARNSLGSVGATASNKILPATTVWQLAAGGYGAGPLAMFFHDNPSASHPLLRRVNLFDLTAGFRVETYGFTKSGSATVTLGTVQEATVAHAFTQSNFQTNIDMGLDSAVLSVKKHQSNIISAPTAGNWWKVSHIKGTGSANPEITAIRFVGEANKAGVTVDSFSNGGFTAAQWLSTYSLCTEGIVGLGPFDVIMLCFGSNDSSTKTGAQYKADIAALISWVRAAYGNSSLPIILTCDYEREHATAPVRTNFQEYPQANYELSQELANVLAINTQRFSYVYGWTEAQNTLTGLTNRGAWSSAAVSYSVNDYVTQVQQPGTSGTGDEAITYYKCISAHTSSATNGPMDRQFWDVIKKLHRDTVHLQQQNALHMSHLIVMNLLSAVGNVSPGVPLRPRGIDRPWVR